MLTRFPIVGGFKTGLFVASIAIAGAAMTRASQAATIFSQPAANNTGSFRSDLQGGEQGADNFSVASANTVVSVHWWGNYDVNPTVAPSFSIRFFLDNGSGSPLATPFSTQNLTSIGVTSTGFTTDAAHGSRPVLDFQANLLSSIPLTAGTTYYISIVENTAQDQWNWSYPGSGGAFYRLADGENWNSDGVNLAFELNNTLVPVPTPPAFGAGLLLLAAMGLTARYAPKAKARIQDSKSE